MEKKAENSTTNYAPEIVAEGIEINFTKIVSGSNTTISGTIKKESTDVGSVSYENQGNYLITQIKPYSNLTGEEVKAVYEAVPDCITEMLND
ncbi:hypothetical protein [Paramuribaculum intestinale]|uniref:hypothetical protein n=1 Tax=Paramuribaculum intestinale TaxID=2094151 RepID=UPI000FFEDD99|nr:hypothetical protein [Paramuribaculum intestinale]RXE62443.1 hypothetical protein ED375_04825 [Muribaculaceae bacterium Isolate-004 (NCI)]